LKGEIAGGGKGPSGTTLRREVRQHLNLSGQEWKQAETIWGERQAKRDWSCEFVGSADVGSWRASMWSAESPPSSSAASVSAPAFTSDCKGELEV